MISKYIFYGVMLQVFCVSMLLAYEGDAQQMSMKETRISLNLENVNLSQAFKAIESKTDFRFSYERKDLDNRLKLNIAKSDASLEDVLMIISENADLKFRRINQNIHVSKKQKKDMAVVDAAQYLQGVTVSGKVISKEDGQGVPGANVLLKGTTSGTVTDINGNYSIDVPGPQAVLVFSSVGFVSEEIEVGNKSVIDITLMPDITALSEIVVIGYGTVKKSDLTGAVVSVDSEELTARPVSNTFEALQGKAAGVDITSNERPGEVGEIRIRGVRSLTATSEPLYVVDGVPLMSESSIETLNPQDIAAIDILKDASATAIYGSRGANGVILITTKKGKEGKLSVNYTGSLTTEKIIDRSPVMNASDYLTWRRWAWYNTDPDSYPRGDQPTIENDRIIFYADADPATWNNIAKGWEGGTWNGSNVESTDWTDYVTQPALTHNHTISASGGTDKIKVYTSFGYLDQEGTQKGQWYKRYTSNLNIDITPVDWFELGASLNASWSDQDYGFSTLGGSSSSGPNSIYEAAKRVYQYAAPYNEDGSLNQNPGGDGNVVTIINEWEYSTQQRQTLRALGSFHAGINFGEITNGLAGLKYRINFGPDFRSWREGVYIDGQSANRLGGNSYARLHNRRDFSWTIDNILTYDKRIGDHSIGLTLLQTASAWNYDGSSISGQNIEKSSYLWNAFNTLDITNSDNAVGIDSYLSERQLASYMARINYSFMDKYLVTVSGRYDGASQLAEGYKWSFFPSAALGWRLDMENFMSSISSVDLLKLRVGVGTTGNAGIDPYATKGGIQAFSVPFGGSPNTQAYTTNEPNYTKDQVAMANPYLGWEITTQYNLGIDFSLFEGRLSGAVDVYKSYTSDLLMDMSISTITGYPSIYANVGETRNRGIDISLHTINVASDNFTWSTNINTAWQKDEIESLAYGDNDMIDNSWFIGESIGVYYDIQSDGLWQASDESEMEKFNANGHDFEAGKVKPVDTNGDYIIDSEDRVILGHEIPRWTFGMTNTFAVRNFELSIMLYGRFGYMIDGLGESQIGRYNQRDIDYWTPDNTDAEWQKPIYNEAGGDAYSGLLGYRDASFLKIRNISLAYNVPNSFLDRYKIEHLKLYVQAKNLGNAYSSIDWIDLDLGGSTFNRGFVFGVNVGF